LSLVLEYFNAPESPIAPDQQGDDELDDADGFGSEDGSDADLLLDGIRDPIDRLFKLAVWIRNPSSRAASKKVLDYRLIDPENGVDLLDIFKERDYDYISSSFLEFQKSRALADHPVSNPSLGGDSGTSADLVWEPIRSILAQHRKERSTGIESFLVHRLAQANTRRRQQFAYWKHHRSKLGLHTKTAMQRAHTQNASQTPHIGLTAGVGTEETAEAHFPMDDTPQARTIVASVTTASRLDVLRAASWNDQATNASVSEYAASAWRPGKEDLAFPQPPKHLSDGKFFECPYCFTLCSSVLLSERAWKAHLIHDLRPYQCTYESCKTSTQLYDSVEGWVKHEDSMHRLTMRCPEHPAHVFSHQEEFQVHLESEHGNRSDEVKAVMLTYASETTVPTVNRCCPVCLANFTTAKDLNSHIARHLERFSLFSLPRSAGDDGADDTGSSKHNLSRGDDSRAEGTAETLNFTDVDEVDPLNQAELTLQEPDRPPFTTEDIPFYQATTLSIRIPKLTPERASQYVKLFWKKSRITRETALGIREPVVGGEEGKAVFEMSGLPNVDLGTIWALVDLEKRGTLTQTEFIIAMHLISSRRSGAMPALPSQHASLPSELYEAAMRHCRGSPPVFEPDTTATTDSTPRQRTPQLDPKDWIITKDDRASYDREFQDLACGNPGVHLGDVAKRFFEEWTFSDKTLGKIFQLVDIGNKGFLTDDEFAAAMCLMRQQKHKGQGSHNPLPKTLPESLMSGSMQIRAINTREESQQQQPRSAVPTMGQDWDSIFAGLGDSPSSLSSGLHKSILGADPHDGAEPSSRGPTMNEDWDEIFRQDDQKQQTPPTPLEFGAPSSSIGRADETQQESPDPAAGKDWDAIFRRARQLEQLDSKVPGHEIGEGPSKPSELFRMTRSLSEGDKEKPMWKDFEDIGFNEPSKDAGLAQKGPGGDEGRVLLKNPLRSALDPPKRGISAFMFFANEQRDNVGEENPGIPFGQMGKILGNKWKALSDSQRAPYEAKAAADKKRYEQERQAYVAGDNEEES